jgi:hypothetical protein
VKKETKKNMWPKKRQRQTLGEKREKDKHVGGKVNKHRKVKKRNTNPINTGVNSVLGKRK